MAEDPNSLQKYEELYQLAKEGLQEEATASKDLDEKATRYLTFLTIIAGFGALALPGLAQTLRPVEGYLDWLSLIFSGLLLIIIFLAAAITLRVFAVHHWTVIPMNEELIEYFEECRYIDILYSLAREIVNATLKNREKITEGKVRLLRCAYRLLFGALAVALVAMIMATVAIMK